MTRHEGPVTPQQYADFLRAGRAASSVWSQPLTHPHGVLCEPRCHHVLLESAVLRPAGAPSWPFSDESVRRRSEVLALLDRREACAWTWSTTQGAPRDIPDLMPIEASSADDVWSRCGELLPLSPTSTNHYACSRREGHGGRHAAGTGERVAAVWSDRHRSAQDVRAGLPGRRPGAGAR